MRCVVDLTNDPHEISLDENVTRTGLHPADEFEAFRRLSENRGLSAEEIGPQVRLAGGAVCRRVGAEPVEAVETEEEDAAAPLSDGLVLDLTAHRTLALRDAIGASPTGPGQRWSTPWRWRPSIRPMSG